MKIIIRLMITFKILYNPESNKSNLIKSNFIIYNFNL